MKDEIRGWMGMLRRQWWKLLLFALLLALGVVNLALGSLPNLVAGGFCLWMSGALLATGLWCDVLSCAAHEHVQLERDMARARAGLEFFNLIRDPQCKPGDKILLTFEQHDGDEHDGCGAFKVEAIPGVPEEVSGCDE